VRWQRLQRYLRRLLLRVQLLMQRETGSIRAEMSAPAHVDRGWRCLYSSAFAMTAMIAVSACAAGTGATGVPDPQAEQRLESATVPAQRVQVLFDWAMTDRDARFSGRGVLRVDSGYRVRVDLFGPR